MCVQQLFTESKKYKRSLNPKIWGILFSSTLLLICSSYSLFARRLLSLLNNFVRKKCVSVYHGNSKNTRKIRMKTRENEINLTCADTSTFHVTHTFKHFIWLQQRHACTSTMQVHSNLGSFLLPKISNKHVFSYNERRVVRVLWRVLLLGIKASNKTRMVWMCVVLKKKWSK